MITLEEMQKIAKIIDTGMREFYEKRIDAAIANIPYAIRREIEVGPLAAEIRHACQKAVEDDVSVWVKVKE